MPKPATIVSGKVSWICPGCGTGNETRIRFCDAIVNCVICKTRVEISSRVCRLKRYTKPRRQGRHGPITAPGVKEVMCTDPELMAELLPEQGYHLRQVQIKNMKEYMLRHRQLLEPVITWE